MSAMYPFPNRPRGDLTDRPAARRSARHQRGAKGVEPKSTSAAGIGSLPAASSESLSIGAEILPRPNQLPRRSRTRHRTRSGRDSALARSRDVMCCVRKPHADPASPSTPATAHAGSTSSCGARPASWMTAPVVFIDQLRRGVGAPRLLPVPTCGRRGRSRRLSGRGCG